MNAPTNELPKQDPYTTYDYNVGADRITAVENKKYKIEYLDATVQALAFQRILENPFNEELRAAVLSGQVRMPRHVPKLKVTYHKNDGETNNEVNALSREKTIEFARNAIVKWGNNAEKVLSATDTGALYWNVIHHFGNFNNFSLNGVQS